MEWIKQQELMYMYGLFACPAGLKSGHGGEVATSGGSTECPLYAFFLTL